MAGRVCRGAWCPDVADALVLRHVSTEIVIEAMIGRQKLLCAEVPAHSVNTVSYCCARGEAFHNSSAETRL
eukprot:COSAG05_NODE_24272_length_252_cov_1.163399_1_plen_70_part_10